MKKSWKFFVICFVVSFILLVVLGLNPKDSFYSSLFVLIVIYWFKSGGFSKILNNIKKSEQIKKDKMEDHRRRQHELKNIRDEEMEREIGRKKADSEYYKRESENFKRQEINKKRNLDRRRFFDDPLGMKKR